MGLSLTGKATVKGFPGTMSGITGAASLMQKSGEVSVQRGFGYLNNSIGEPVGTWAVEGLMFFDMVFTIQATSVSNTLLPLLEPVRTDAPVGAPQVKVTLASFPSATGELNHARWIVVPGTWRLSFSDENILEFRMQIVCSTDATVDLTTAIS